MFVCATGSQCGRRAEPVDVVSARGISEAVRKSSFSTTSHGLLQKLLEGNQEGKVGQKTSSYHRLNIYIWITSHVVHINCRARHS